MLRFFSLRCDKTPCKRMTRLDENTALCFSSLSVFHTKNTIASVSPWAWIMLNKTTVSRVSNFTILLHANHLEILFYASFGRRHRDETLITSGFPPATAVHSTTSPITRSTHPLEWTAAASILNAFCTTRELTAASSFSQSAGSVKALVMRY